MAKLGLGTLRLPMNDNNEIEEKEIVKVIKKSIKSGIKYFDLGPNYAFGEAEKIFRLGIEGEDRENYIISDKMFPLDFLNPEEYFNERLKALGVSFLDRCYIHAISEKNINDVIEKDLFNFLLKKKQEEKIKETGASFHMGYTSFKQLVLKNRDFFDFVQLPINYEDWNGDVEKEYNLCKELGIKVTAMSPLKGGYLGKKCSTSHEKALKKWVDKGYSYSDIAMLFSSSMENVDYVLTGTIDEETVIHNKGILESGIRFCEAEIVDLGNIGEKIRKERSNYCTKCGYCLRCPKGIKIPRLIEAYNNSIPLFKYPVDETAKVAIKENLIPNECNLCKLCEKSCPQGIQPWSLIQDLMESEILQKRPVVYGIEDQVIENIASVHIAHNTKHLNLSYRAEYRLIQTILGKDKDDQFHVIKDDELKDFEFDTTNLENGTYELKITAYDNENPKNYYIESKPITFIVFNNSSDIFEDEYVIRREYKENEKLDSYENKLVLEKSNLNTKGILLEVEITTSVVGLYHDIDLTLEVDGVLENESYSVIFEKDKKGEDRSGNKCGIAFIPIELKDDSSIRVLSHYKEYSNKEKTILMDDVTEYLLPQNFKRFAYIDFEEKKPSVKIRELDENKIQIDFENINHSIYSLWTKVEREKEPSKWHEVSELKTIYEITNAGRYLIFGKVIDRKSGDMVIERELEYLKEIPIEMKISSNDEFYMGEEIKSSISFNYEANEINVEAWIKNHPEKMINITKNEKACELTIDSLGLPYGLHTVLISAKHRKSEKVYRKTYAFYLKEKVNGNNK